MHRQRGVLTGSLLHRISKNTVMDSCLGAHFGRRFGYLPLAASNSL